MWIVVGMAGNQELADKMKGILESEGILVKLRNISVRANTKGNTYEVLVLESESDSAREILLENGL